GEPWLQLTEAEVAGLQRQFQVGRAGVGLRQQPVAGKLAQVDEALVVREQGGSKVGEAVEAQAPDHRPLEASHQPVGEEERPGLVVHQPLELLRPGEHLVAVGPTQAQSADLVQHRVETTAGAAVTVDDDQTLVARLGLAHAGAHPFNGPLRVEVGERRGKKGKVGGPVPAVGDVVVLPAERTKDDEGGGGAHPTASSSGKRSTATNVSLKSARPESSTYSTTAGRSKATWRSR